MRKSIVSIALIGAAMWAGTAQADPGYDSCEGKAVTNVDYSACGAAWIAREERRLNVAWKALYSRLPARSKASLLSEQRLWIAWKDKSCLWRARGDWGREGQVIAYPTCRAKVIADRADYLETTVRDLRGR